MAKQNKNKINGSNVRLSRKQVLQLVDIMNSVPAVKAFYIQEEYNSGIGTHIFVQFNIFNRSQEHDGNASIDITDVGEW